jgi:acetyl esterase
MSTMLLGADAQRLAETRAFNARLEQALAAEEPLTESGISEARQRRREGSPTGFPPRPVFLEQAEELDVRTRAGATRVRILAPERARTGIYLHLHGGGWVVGAADLQDALLFELAQETGLCAVSVEYRLAPEDPHPAAAHDCEDVALWLLSDGPDTLRAPAQFVIGGESAGAHLAVHTLLRLRDGHGLGSPFAAANLSFGAFDLSLSPSARLWGDRNLILSTPGMEFFLDCFLPGIDRESRRGPEISPLSARLDGLPPAIFTVGTQDPLLDDTLFMHARWGAAGNPAELRVWSEATHAFLGFPIEIAREARAEQQAFLRQVLSAP